MTAYFDEKEKFLGELDASDYEGFDSFDREIVHDMDLGVHFLRYVLPHVIIKPDFIASLNSILSNHFLYALPYNHASSPDYVDLESQRRGYQTGLMHLHTWWHGISTEYGVSDDPRSAMRMYLGDMVELRS